MIHDTQHTITALGLVPPMGLRLTFADGAAMAVDLAPTIAAHKALAALADAALFATARIDARGGYVVFAGGDIELAADNLRHLAVEQAGGIGHERIWNWMHQAALTQERAAEAIGVSRRMLNYYLSGAKPIPKTVWLACLGWKSQQRPHPGKRSPVASRVAV